MISSLNLNTPNQSSQCLKHILPSNWFPVLIAYYTKLVFRLSIMAQSKDLLAIKTHIIENLSGIT